MATGTPTTNLGLRIMNGTDPVDVADINANSQTLDDKIGAVGSTSLQAQITLANQAIANLNVATQISDFNSAITTGLYKAPPGTTNQPLNDYNVLYVFAYNTVGNDIAQLSVGINNRRMFFRTRRDGTTWMSWQELALNSDLTKVTNVVDERIASNANNVKEGGTWYLIPSSTNKPTSEGYFIVYVLVRNANNVSQIAIDMNDGRMFVRTFHDGTTWTSWEQLALNSQKGIVVVGDVTFSSGTGSKTVNGIKQGARLIAQRRQGSATSIILTAICNADNTVSFGAYDSSGSGSNYSGTLSGIILAYDNT